MQIDVSPRKSNRIVDKFVRGRVPIEGKNFTEVAKKLRRDKRAGSVQHMADRLEKRFNDNRLFQYKEGGKTFLEPVGARVRRLNIAKGASKSDIINAEVSAQVVAA